MIRENVSLRRYNTFGIDVRARYLATFKSARELREICRQVAASGLPHLVMGGGSNLLFTRDFDGWIIKSGMYGKRIVETGTESSLLEVDAGVRWDNLVVWSIAHQLYGLENLSLIPGTAGASAVQNIGAYGAEAKDCIESVCCMEIGTGKMFRFRNEELHYGYRTSRFKTEWAGRFVITSVRFRLNHTPQLHIDYQGLREAVKKHGGANKPEAIRQAVCEIRRAKLPDPAKIGNAGSFFKNPVVSAEWFAQLQASHPDMPHYPAPADQVKIPAAWLIEQCGWKGKNMGRAGVYPMQPLVLVNRGNADGTEIVALAESIMRDVREQFGIDLQPEVIIL